MPLDGNPGNSTTVKEVICKTLTFPIIPVRYSVVPETSKNNNHNLSDYKNLEKPLESYQNSKYTLRTLRHGYLYLYNGVKMLLWEANGDNTFTSLTFNSQEEYAQAENSKSTFDKGETLNSIWAHDNVDEVWVGYFPALLTQKGVQRLISDTKLRQRVMKHLKISELLDGAENPSTQKNTMPIEDLQTAVEEFKADRERLDWSSSDIRPKMGCRTLTTKMNSIYPKARPKVPVVLALNDPEGMAMDLGLIANFFCHQLLDVRGEIAQSERPMQCNEVPHDVFLDTSFICDVSKDYHRELASAGMIESTLLANVKNPSSYGGKDIYARWEQLKGDDSVKRYLNKIRISDLDLFYDKKKKLDCKLEDLEGKVLMAINDHARILETGEKYKVDNPSGLASLWDLFDRENYLSANSLEHSVAFCIDGIGDAPLGHNRGDRRIKLRDSWARDAESPIYLGLDAYRPILDKKDSMADVAGGVGELIGGVYHKYPYTIATDIIVSNTTSWFLTRVKNQRRWFYSKNLLDSFEEAKKISDAKPFVEALMSRYEIAKNIEARPIESITKRTYLFLDRTKELLENNSKGYVTANREGLKELLVVKNHTRSKKVKPLARASNITDFSNAGLNGGMTLLVIWNLASSIQALREKVSIENSASLISAIAGFAGAISESARITISLGQKHIPKTYLVGRSAVARLSILVASKAVTKAFGFVGAAFEAITSIAAAGTAFQRSDKDAGWWFMGAGVSLGAGGVLFTVALGVPGLGWMVAVGVLLTLAGMWLVSKAHEAKDTPAELWLNATNFGMQDSAISKTFGTLEQEINAHFLLNYTPKDIGGDWEGWLGFGDAVEFNVFLPRCQASIASCEFKLEAFKEDDIRNNKQAGKCSVYKVEKNPVVIEDFNKKEGGVVLNITHDWDDGEINSCRLKLKYTPDSESIPKTIHCNFYVDD